jgi:hypothetical protein
LIFSITRIDVTVLRMRFFFASSEDSAIERFGNSIRYTLVYMIAARALPDASRHHLGRPCDPRVSMPRQVIIWVRCCRPTLSPLASLCLPLYDIRSPRVRPSCAVKKLMLAHRRRSVVSSRSELPTHSIGELADGLPGPGAITAHTITVFPGSIQPNWEEITKRRPRASVAGRSQEPINVRVNNSKSQ